MKAKNVYAIRCAVCGAMKTAGDKSELAQSARADGWKRVNIMTKDGVTNKKPVCGACLRKNPTAEFFGLVEMR